MLSEALNTAPDDAHQASEVPGYRGDGQPANASFNLMAAMELGAQISSAGLECIPSHMCGNLTRFYLAADSALLAPQLRHSIVG